VVRRSEPIGTATAPQFFFSFDSDSYPTHHLEPLSDLVKVSCFGDDTKGLAAGHFMNEDMSTEQKGYLAAPRRTGQKLAG
jgi:hypothetical protein